MTPVEMQQLFSDRGYLERTNDDEKDSIRKVLNALKINPASELGHFYVAFAPSLIRSRLSHKQLNDVLYPSVKGTTYPVDDPFDTPLGMATMFIREVWEVPDRFICLTSTEGEGAYLYDLSSEEVYYFDLAQQPQLVAGELEPRWHSFEEFIKWYLS